MIKVRLLEFFQNSIFGNKPNKPIQKSLIFSSKASFERSLWIFLFICLMAFQQKGSAYDDTPSCFKEVQRSFFQESVIIKAFGIYYRDIFQSQWNNIAQDLLATNPHVYSTVKEKAKRMKRSPFENPFQYKESEELLQSIAWGFFLEVMHRHYITNQPLLKEVFNIIFEAEKERLKACSKIQ